MRIFIIILFLVCFTTYSCKTSKDTNRSKLIESTENYFSMYRSGCYGRCPSYKIKIQRDGNFVYFGKSNVKNIGEKIGILSEEQVNKLFENLKSYKWESYLDEYPITNVDFPGFTLEYANGKTIKKIKGDANAPKKLKELTLEIDAILKKINY